MTQFVCYMPYGETLVDEHTTTYENPFKFSGKELDDVTSLYYYGARYMDPKSMCWYSLDRYMEKYPELSPYSFCAGNPVKITDVNGDSLFVLHAPNGASGFGHLAILIQDPDNGGKMGFIL